MECIFTWYWLADLCDREGLHFVLAHALYLKAVHGGKTKNDRIDALKIADLLRGRNIPVAYAYPAYMRATRDLLRRRTHLMHKRSELLSHIQNTASQYNLPSPGKLTYPGQRVGVADRFPDPMVRRSVELNITLIDVYNPLLRQLEKELVATAKIHDPTSFELLRSVPGIGKILGMTLLYEIHDINRFPRPRQARPARGSSCDHPFPRLGGVDVHHGAVLRCQRRTGNILSKFAKAPAWVRV